MYMTRLPAIALSSALFVLASCTSEKSAPPAAHAPAASSAPAPAVKSPPPAQAQAPAQQSAPVQPIPAVAPAQPGAATATPEDPELSAIDLGVPTQEDADLEAEQSINADNADAALEELEQELEGGGQ
jgi:hypothetical protein